MGEDRHSFNGHTYRKLKADQRAKGLPCWICGQPIDYRAANPDDDDAFSYDHVKPWRDYPELRYDPDNGRSAHQRCNKSRGLGQRAPALDLGIPSELW
jgi:5-methylcytosine-specific restriction endonuclease McrA